MKSLINVLVNLEKVQNHFGLPQVHFIAVVWKIFVYAHCAHFPDVVSLS